MSWGYPQPVTHFRGSAPRRGNVRGCGSRWLGQAIRDKLGGSLCTGDPFPKTPKRMRWKTYWHLKEQEEAADHDFFSGIMRAFGGHW